jgi:colicin import membrane protein
MPRKLKTYQTSLGFFDLAIAAPSMKAALEAWGSTANLFHQGFAWETEDAAVVAATMAEPGVVLKRAVGSKGRFSENAELPKSLPAGKKPPKPAKVPTKTKAPKHTANVVSLADERAARRAAGAYEKERDKQEREERKEEAARQKERAARDQATAKARTALEEAEQSHDEKVSEIEDERTALDKRADAEQARWDKQKAKLDADLRSARD